MTAEVRERFGRQNTPMIVARRLMAVAAMMLTARPAAGQWLDARLPGRGELQVGLSGANVTVESRFLPDGSKQPLAEALSVTLDARLVPTLETLDSVVAELLGEFGREPSEASTLGALQFDVLFEQTRAPLSLSFGVTDWLAAFAVVPLVKGRSFVAPAVEPGSNAAGPTASAFGEDPDALFSELSGDIAALESVIAADTLSADLQAEAEALVSQARAFEAGLTTLRTLPYVPTGSSGAGQQITSIYAELQAGFSRFDVELPTLSLADPVDPAAAAEIAAVADFGIEPPQRRSTGVRFGDIELGVSVQPLNSFRRAEGDPRPTVLVRAKLEALYRFASGAPRAAERITDPGTGDGQADIELRSTLDFGLGRRLWLSLFAGYNLQLEATAERLVTLPVAPIQFGAYTARVRWDPGDVVTLAAAPRLNITRNITVSGLYIVTQRERDRIRPLDSIPADAPFVPTDLEDGTEYTSRSAGFALRYSSGDWTTEAVKGTPVDVELRYLKTADASDGLVPGKSVWQVALRVYPTVLR